MAGFSWDHGVAGDREEILKLPMANSATVTVGDALEFTSGKKLQRVNAQTDVGLFISLEDYTTTSTEFKELKVCRTEGGIFRVNFTPLCDDLAAASNATTTVAKCALTDGSSDDLLGGVVYCKELDEYRVISANTYSSNVVTITVVEPFSRAITTGDTVRVVPFGPGTRALKFGASNYHKTIGTAVGDQASGKLIVSNWKKDCIKKKYALIQFLQA